MKHLGIGILFGLGFVASLNAMDQLEPKHSFSNPKLMLVESTALDLTINFDKKILSGTATLQAKRLKGTELRLDTALLNITSIQGDVISWHKHSDPEFSKKNLGEPLVIQTADKDLLTIVIAYETDPKAPGLVWMDAHQTRSGEPFMFAMNEPIGARSWFPCQDTPGVRGTFTADLKIVANQRTSTQPLMALISGENNPRQANVEMSYKNLRSTNAPIPTYLFVLAAGRFFYQAQDTSETIGYYSDNQKTLQDALAGFAAVPKYFATLKELLGDNPWSRQDFLFVPAMFGFGGMENPMLIYINEGLVDPTGASSYVMAHELAHMWTGNVVTNKKWSGFWINEGWTSYYEDRALEAVHGYAFGAGNSYERHQELIAAERERLSDVEGKLTHQPTRLHKVATKHIHPDDLTEFSVYGKGSSMLRNIEVLIGRKNFDVFAREYIKDFSFKPITSQMFAAYSAEKLSAFRSDIAWTDYLKAWIFEPGMHPTTCAQEVLVPECVGCKEKSLEFSQEAADTNFTTWNRFQIIFLLSELEKELRQKNPEANYKLELLINCPSFIETIMPIADIRSLWYQVLVLGSAWSPYAQEMKSYLGEFGRGRLIKPLYTALVESQDDEAIGFAKKTYLENQQRYFAPVSKGIGALLEKSTQ